MSLEQIFDKLRSRAHQPLTEVHVVNGLHPDLPFEYYLDMLRGLKKIRPGVHLKCFTAVEIAFFADTYGMTDEAVLRSLMDAGLDSLPGGGAEILVDRVRGHVSPKKATSDQWLGVMREAHELDISTTATMMFGGIETPEERVEHLRRVREVPSSQTRSMLNARSLNSSGRPWTSHLMWFRVWVLPIPNRPTTPHFGTPRTSRSLRIRFNTTFPH